MKQFEILRIESLFNIGLRCHQFAGFKLKGVVGTVDPFVDGELEVESMQIFIDNTGEIIDGKEAEYIDAEMKWAKSQVGKLLCVDDLHYSAFATSGKVEISALNKSN